MRRFCVPLFCAALSSPFVLVLVLAQAQAQAQARPPAFSPGPVQAPSPGLDTASPTATADPSAVTRAALPTAPPASDGDGALTLDQALQTALSRNPLLRAAEAEVAASRGAVDQAGVWRNPELSIEQEDVRAGTRSTTVALSQTFELGGKRAARVALARTAGGVALAELAARQADIRASTVQAFFDALIAEERVTVAREFLTIAARGTTTAARRVTAGSVSPTEETRARVVESNARIDLHQAEVDRQAARRVLGLAMGLPESGSGRFDGRLDGRAEALPPLPDAQRLAERLAQAPGLMRSRGEVERAEASYQLERSRRTPDLTVSLGALRAQEVGRNQAVIGLSIPLPIFDSNQGAQLEALRRRDAAAALAQAEAQRLDVEVRQAVDQLRARSAEVQALQQDVLPGARSAWEAASRGFELGKFGFLDVLDAQRTWLQARTRYLGALALVHGAAADLERRLGPANANPDFDRPTPGTQQ